MIKSVLTVCESSEERVPWTKWHMVRPCWRVCQFSHRRPLELGKKANAISIHAAVAEVLGQGGALLAGTDADAGTVERSLRVPREHDLEGGSATSESEAVGSCSKAACSEISYQIC